MEGTFQGNETGTGFCGMFGKVRFAESGMVWTDLHDPYKSLRRVNAGNMRPLEESTCKILVVC